MASSNSKCPGWVVGLAVFFFVALASTTANGDGLSASYYDQTCPNAQGIVQSVLAGKIAAQPRIAPAVLRLFFHDCFVNGCDGSLLLDATPFSGSEKDAEPNASLAGFDAIDAIKSALEQACPATVSCADILALASRDAVAALGGPAWAVLLGRKDSRAANRAAADGGALPKAGAGLAALTAEFAARGLDARDMAALSGAHTIGMASCKSFGDHVFGGADIDPSFAAARQQTCRTQGAAGKVPFDTVTPMRFDNAYYQELVARRGLLASDQALYDGGPLDGLVRVYSTDGAAFARDFAVAMVKMGNIPPPMGMPAEVRLKCSMVN